MAKGVKTGGGSRAGIPNKITSDVRNMVVNALNKAGGEQYLFEQAQENPKAFLTLVAKCIPANVNIGGQSDSPIITKIEIVPMSSSNDSNQN